MNFLGHLLLSGSSDEVRLGNFLGDFVASNAKDHYPRNIQNGFTLHYAIDTFTDTHPAVRKSVRLFQKEFHHYSRVIVDIIFDHFIALDWQQYHNQPLEEFSQNIYDTLLLNKEFLPKEVEAFLPSMIRDNWLVNYGTNEGIYRALKGMSRRARYNNELENALTTMHSEFEPLRSFVREFIPDALIMSASLLETFNSESAQ